MIVASNPTAGIIRPSPPNVVMVRGRGLPHMLASLRRTWQARSHDETTSRESEAAASPNPEDHERDRVLMQGVRERDEAALTALYDHYAPLVTGLATSILRDSSLAEEATHDVFLRLWQQPSAYDPARGTFAGWLLRVARNRAIDLRRQRREAPASAFEVDAISMFADPEPGPEEQALAGLRRDEVRRALETLAPDHRQLLELAYMTGLSQAQIARRLERPLGTVKSQIRAAMARLAEGLAPVDADLPDRLPDPGERR
jgi:RNA polymerase sigma-70 factor, ECF subfamily